MPIYWRESNPAATEAIASDNLLNQVATISSVSSQPKHPANAKLGYTTGNVPRAYVSGYPYIYPPIYIGGIRQNFNRPGALIDGVLVTDSEGYVDQNTGFTLSKRGAVVVVLLGSGGASTNGYTLNDDRAPGGSGCCQIIVFDYRGETIKWSAGAGGVKSSGIGSGGTGAATWFYCDRSDLGYVVAGGAGGGNRGNAGLPGTNHVIGSGLDFEYPSYGWGGGYITLVQKPGDGRQKSDGTDNGKLGSGAQYYGSSTGSVSVPGGMYVGSYTAASGGAAPSYGLGNGNNGGNGRIIIIG